MIDWKNSFSCHHIPFFGCNNLVPCVFACITMTYCCSAAPCTINHHTIHGDCNPQLGFMVINDG